MDRIVPILLALIGSGLIVKMRRYASAIVLFFGLLVTLPAHAQAYPNRPVRVIVPLAPGGGMDIVTRGLAPKLGEIFGQTFVVDNRPGAGNLVALDILDAAVPDGHTLMMISPTTLVYPMLYKSRFDVARDFAPVSQVTSQGYVLVVHPAVPATTALELVQHLRANRGKLNYGSSGVGSLLHLSGELFQIATGTRMTHIPFKGMGAAYADLIGGQIQLAFATIVSSLPHIKAGRLRALAVTLPQRAFPLPDTPTLGEAGVPGVIVVSWIGLIAPAATPKGVIERVGAATTKAMRTPEMKARLLADGSNAVGGSPHEFAVHLKGEQNLWGRVVKQAGIRGE
jgi:tripartite-type tricarboxylate transporter receptor subunit TctC